MQAVVRPSVNCTLFSPCGGYLLCGTALGRLHIWHFANGGGTTPSRSVSLQAQAGAIYALVFAETAARICWLPIGEPGAPTPGELRITPPALELCAISAARLPGAVLAMWSGGKYTGFLVTNARRSCMALSFFRSRAISFCMASIC